MRRLLPGPAKDQVDIDEAYLVESPGRSYVRGNMVSSVDGAAQAEGRSGGLSGPTDKKIFAALRDHADVILAGASTVRVERYGGHRPSARRQEWRTARGMPPLPTMAVLSRSCDFDPEAPFFTDQDVRPIVITQKSAPAHRVDALRDRADIIVAGDGDVDLPAALGELADRGLHHLLCEGGPNLLSHIVAAGQLHELCLTLSPLLFAGPATRILDGPLLDAPEHLTLHQVLEDDSYLFLRYLRR